MIKHVQIELRGDNKWWIHPTDTSFNDGPFNTLAEAKTKAYLMYPVALISVYDPEED